MTTRTRTRKLYFCLPDVAALVREIQDGTDHVIPDYMDGAIPEGPALMWVKDDGTYLMGNQARAEDEVPTIVRGRADSPHGPILDGTQWDLTREICGGDDFAEYLPLADDDLGSLVLRAHQDRAALWLVLGVEATSYGEVGTFSVSLY